MAGQNLQENYATIIAVEPGMTVAEVWQASARIIRIGQDREQHIKRYLVENTYLGFHEIALQSKYAGTLAALASRLRSSRYPYPIRLS